MSIYGEIVTASSVREAVVTTIQKWIDSYLGELAAQHGRKRGVLPVFRSYHSSAQGFQHWPEDQVPACIIVCPGISSGSIEMHSDNYTAEWPVGIGVLCSSLDHDATMELVELYTAAVRALILQHGSLGGFATETRWIDEDYDALTHDDSRTLAGGTVNLGVRVDAVLSSAASPAVPPSDPVTTPDPVPVVVTADPVVNGNVGEFDQEIDV